MVSLPPLSGPIGGVGIDVVSIPRFADSLRRTPALADKLFTPAERVTASGRPRTDASLAARFAAKEAVAKALGVPLGMDWHDCVITVDDARRPAIEVTGTVAAACAERGITGWQISLTHDAGIAAAVVIALG